MTTKLYVGTKKGAFIFTSNDRKNWDISDPILFGNIIYHIVPDPRNPDHVLLATTTGHLGPTVYHSTDAGKTWKEAEEPPKFSDPDKSVKFVFWLSPGHPDEPDVWWAGVSPQGLFRSEDGGKTWVEFTKFSSHPLIEDVMKDNFGTPIGPLLHSINMDPTDKNRMILAMSQGGAFETRDYGENWEAFNGNVLADFLPDPYPETGHCVHNMQLHPKSPNIIYQQGHCGVYRIDRSNNNKDWVRIGDNLPDEIGDIGFPLILHPQDPDKLWVVPMDGTDVWPRTSVDGKPAFYVSEDGGNSWSRQDTGLPSENAWFTVLRQACAHDNQSPLGLYLGNRNGEVWASADEGDSFSCIKRNLPDVFSIEAISD